MANILTTFTSGIIVGSSAVYAFTAYFTERSQIMNYKLRKAAAVLRETNSGNKQNMPEWEHTRPDILNKYDTIASHISNNAIPLAKTEWNAKVSSLSQSIASVDLSTDKIAGYLRKD